MADGGRNVHPNALPNYQNAVIQRDKLEGFSLNLIHGHGKHHARVFKSALGFDKSNWDLLEQQVRKELPYYEAVLKEENQYGTRYNVILPMAGPNGRAVDVLTAWIIKIGTDYPFLTTTYVVGD
jgi:hypothetical protein